MNRPFQDILAQVGGYYTEKIRAHGSTAKGVDWNSEESQRLRYQQLLRILDDPRGGNPTSPPPLVLNDIGCGYGYLCEYLDTIGTPVEYRGLDVSAEMISSARIKYGNRPATHFVTEADELPPGDFSIASGIFNVRLTFSSEQWEEYIISMLTMLREKSNRGFAFNMLTSYSDPEKMRADLHYANPATVFDICKRNFSRDVAVLHDYGLYEFTVLVRLPCTP